LVLARFLELVVMFSRWYQDNAAAVQGGLIQLARAVAFMEGRYREPLSIDLIAAEAVFGWLPRDDEMADADISAMRGAAGYRVSWLYLSGSSSQPWVLSMATQSATSFRFTTLAFWPPIWIPQSPP
jgi:hypothetical protein